MGKTKHLDVVLSFIILSFIYVPGYAGEIIKYSRDAAVAYSSKHCDTNNYNDNQFVCYNKARPQCEFQSGSDCANFASQALIDGGLNFNKFPQVSPIGKNDKAGTKGHIKVALLLPTLEDSFCFSKSRNIELAQPGDILSQISESHVVVYKGDNRYNGHTTDRCGEFISDNFWKDIEIYHYEGKPCDDCIQDTNLIAKVQPKCGVCSKCLVQNGVGVCESLCTGWGGTCAPLNKCVVSLGVPICVQFGPGGDCPDDNFSVGASTPLNKEPVHAAAAASVGVLNNGYPNDMLKVLSTFGQDARLVEVDRLDPNLATQMPLLIIPSGGLIGISDSEFLRASFSGYVDRGGTIVVYTQQHGSAYDAIPGGLAGYGWQEDQSCQSNSSYIDTWHLMLAGQTRATPSVNVDGYFTGYPDNSTVILRRTVNGQPVLIAYPYGNGMVIAISAYTDFAYTSNQASHEEIRLLRDIVSWALAPALLPEFKPGQLVTANVTVANYDNAATALAAEIELFGPYRDGVKLRTKVPVNLSPGQSAQIPVPYSTTADSPPGIYHVSYGLLSEKYHLLTGELVPQGEYIWGEYLLQPPVEDLSARFVLSNPPTGSYWMSGLKASVTIPSDFYFPGVPVEFTVHLWNYTDNTQKLRLYKGWSHDPMTLLEEVAIPAGASFVQSYTDMDTQRPGRGLHRLWVHIFSETGLIIKEIYFPNSFPRPAGETWGYAGSFGKGFETGYPSVAVAARTAKANYAKGETVAIATSLVNAIPTDWGAAVKVTVADAVDNVIFSDTMALPVVPRGQSSLSTSFTLPPDLAIGTYTVRSDVLFGTLNVGSAATRFTLPASQISVNPIVPALLNAGSNAIAFRLTNAGLMPVNSGQLSITLIDPDNTVVFEDARTYALDIGQSIDLNFDLPVPPLKFGDYFIGYVQSDETRPGKQLRYTLQNPVPRISVTFDKASYRMREPVAVDIDLENQGRFNLDAATLAFSMPVAGYADARAVSLQPNVVNRSSFTFQVPDNVAAGLQSISVTLTSPSGNAVTQGAALFVPESVLKIGHSGPTAINAGTSINITIENPGGVDTSYVTTKLALHDKTGVSLYDTGANGTVLAGETRTLVDIPVSPQTVQGPAYLEVMAKNSRTSGLSYLSRTFDVNGVNAALSTATEKPAYLRTESITGFANVSTGAIGIDNGTLGVTVSKVGGASTGQFATFLPKGYFPFQQPRKLATGAKGIVYVSDFVSSPLFGHEVQKFDNGKFVGKLGGSGTEDGQFVSPSGVAVGPDGSVFVADTGITYQNWSFVDTGLRRIQKFDNNGNFVAKWGSLGSGNGQFGKPWGVAVGPDGFVYVTDLDNHNVQKFDASGNFVARWGSLGSGDGQFNCPEDIAVGPDGYIYVMDSGNGRVQKFDGNGIYVAQWGGFSSSGGGLYSGAAGVAVTPDGFVYVSDRGGNRVQKFSNAGTLIGEWGTSGSGYGQFAMPTAIAADKDGNVYVAEIGNIRIQKFDGNGQFISMWGAHAFEDGWFRGRPAGVAVDSTGFVYAVDANMGYVQKFDRSGNFVTKWEVSGCGEGQMGSPIDIGVSADGFVYVTAFRGCVQKFDAYGNFITKWGDSSGNTIHPEGIAVGPDGSVYVTDSYSSRIHKFDGQGNSITVFTGCFYMSWGGTCYGVAGPEGIAVASDGSVYVADTLAHAVRRFDGNGNYLNGWGSQGSGDGQFYYPSGVSVGPDGSVYVADTENHRVQKFAGNGAFLGKWGANGSDEGMFSSPMGITADSDGSVYVADTWNNRIQKLTPAGDGGFTRLFETTLAVTQDANTSTQYTTPIGTLNATGKLYLTADIKNSVGQVLASAEYPFYVVEGNTLLLFSADKKVYRPGEAVMITGEVKNLSAIDAVGLNLALAQGSQSLYSAAFDVPAGGSYPFTATTTASNVGSYPLKGTVTQNGSNLAEIVDQYEVAAPTLTAALSAPSVVGNDPFDLSLEFKNTGKVAATVGFQSPLDNQAVSVSIPAGETRSMQYSLHVAGTTTYSIAITGDLEQTLAATVNYGLAASISIEASSVYTEGPVAVPVTVTNPGQLPVTMTVSFLLSPSASTETRTYSMPAGGSVSDTFHYTLTPGSYTVTAACQSPQAAAQAEFSVRKAVDAGMTATIGTWNGGLLPVTAVLTNTGYDSVGGTVLYTVTDGAGAIVWSSEEAVSELAPLASQSLTSSINTASFDPGTYTVSVSLRDNGGRQIAATSASFVRQAPLLQIAQMPPYQTFSLGQEGDLTFTVVNAGSQDETFAFRCNAYDLFDSTQTGTLRPGEQTTLAFRFELPDDLEEKDYFANYELAGGSGIVVATGQVKYHLAGVNVSVAASLDKSSYADGEGAHLTLDLQPASTEPRNFFAKINYSGYEAQQPFTLAGARTLTLDVPLTRITGQKLFYGIYLESGRAIHLNSIYVRKSGEALTVVTDNQVYRPSATVGFTVTSGLSAASSGTMTVKAADYFDSFPFSGTVGKSFQLPPAIPAGTYTVNALLTTSDGSIYSVDHPFEVAGTQVKVLDWGHDKARYAATDTMVVRYTISSNDNVAATLKARMIDPTGNVTALGESSIALSESANTIHSVEYPIVSGVSGIHRLIYELSMDNALLTSGIGAFDVGSAILYGISTDKWDYPTHTEPVTARVSGYGTTDVRFDLLLDGELVRTESLSPNGVFNFDAGLGSLGPGRRTLKCVLTSGGLTSARETVFLYGTNLPDLVVEVAPPRLAPGMDNAFLIGVAVTNQGKTASEPTTVAIYDGETLVGTVNVDALSPRETRGYELLWDVLGKAGAHALKAIVNASGAVVEFDAANNTVNAGAAVPDVALVTRTELETYKIGRAVAIVSSVRNLTSGTAFDNLSVATSVTDPSGQVVFSDTAVVASIGPAGGVTQTAAWSTTGLAVEGVYTIRQTVSSGIGVLAQTSNSVRLVKPPDFTVGPINDYGAIKQGQQAVFTVSIRPLNGWNAELNLRIEGLPAGASAELGANRLTPPGEAVVQVSAGATTEARQHTLSIVAEGIYQGETVTRQLPLTLDVSGFGLNAVDPTRTAIQLEPAVFDVNLGFLNGYAGTVALGVEGVPRGTRAALDVSTATAPGPLKLTVQTSKYVKPGVYSLTLKGNDGLVTHEFPLTLVLQANPAIAQGIIATQGAGAQNEAAVRFFNGTYLQLFEFMAFDTYFGANAASADLDGDGIDEIVAARGGGSTNPATLKAFSKAGVPIVEHTPFGSLYGLVVASGDFDGDWKDEIVAAMGPDPNNPSTIKVLRFDGAGFVETGVSFDAFGASDNVYGYGANLAVGDMDGDGVPEIVAAPGPGPENLSRVRVFKIDASGIPGSWSVVGTGPDFIAFPGLTYGVDVATGDVDGDGAAEIIVGTGPGPNTMPLVRIYKGDGTYTGVEFIAYPDLHNSYGVSVAGVDVNGDGITEVVTGSRQGPLDIAWINVFSPGGAQLGSFLAFPDRVKYGVKVFKGNVGQ